MGTGGIPLKIFLGWDGREAVASDVAAHSIRRRTKANIDIQFLKHRDLRAAGKFNRPWLIEGATGNFVDLLDSKPFSTEFSHTRFLVPNLMNYSGWALFMDADMVVTSDIAKLFELADAKCAVQVVKHNHIIHPNTRLKMDGRAQLAYHRKNWSSFVLWNCGHPLNRQLTPEKVNFMRGADLHAFSWLTDDAIGALPYRYNYISGVSPALPIGEKPAVIHYTDGGPWFDNCRDVTYADLWLEEYEDYQNNGEIVISGVPSTAFETR